MSGCDRLPESPQDCGGAQASIGTHLSGNASAIVHLADLALRLGETPTLPKFFDWFESDLDVANRRSLRRPNAANGGAKR